MRLTKTLALMLSVTPIVCTAEVNSVVIGAVDSNAMRAIPANQSFSLPPLKFVTYTNHDNPTAMALFLGSEMPFNAPFLMQLGVGYYQNQAYNFSGQEGENQNFSGNTFSYQQKVFSRRYMLESKLLSTITTRYPLHPYLLGGVGTADNKAYGFKETPVANLASSHPTNLMSSRHANPLTYSLGLGMDVDVSRDFKVGANYRYSDLGNPQNISDANPLNTLNYKNIAANEIMLTLSFIK